MKRFVMLLLAAVFISGCVGQSTEKPLVLKDGTRCIEYEFASSLKDITGVPLEEKLQVQELILQNRKLNIIYESHELDNPGFILAGVAIANKLATYNTYVLLRVPVIMNYELSNATNLTGLNIRLKGPNTGANETSVSIKGGAIVVQGTSNVNLRLAGERLVLVMLEDLINNKEQEKIYLQRCKT